jgi:anti-sigma-K factor RskA
VHAEGSGHDRWGDSVASYLLGALPAAEREPFEAHLAGCPACRQEVDDLAIAVDALPMSVPPLVPPPELKDRIMAVVEREASLLAAAGPAADRPPAPARRRWALPRLSPRIATAMAAVLAIGVLVGFAGNGLLAGGGRTVTATVDPGAAPGARAQVELDDGEATLVARGLPAPPAGRVYQVWLKRDGRAPEPTAALFLPARDGTATTSVPGRLGDVDQVLVTDEPAGGSAAPTRDPFIVATMS